MKLLRTYWLKRVANLAVRVMMLSLLIVSYSFSQTLTDPGSSETKKIIPGYLVLQLASDEILFELDAKMNMSFASSSLAQLVTNNGLTDFKKVFPWRQDDTGHSDTERELSRFYQLRFPDSLDVFELAEQMIADPGVVMAEPVWLMRTSVMEPDDPYLGSQWHVDMINLPAAWNLQTASSSVKLALIDTGVQYKHPDLVGNIWVNPGEDIDGDGTVYDSDDLNGIDDDSNGVVDDLIGYDFLTTLGLQTPPGEDPGTPDSDPMDFHGHGTHISGIAAAMTNNSTGGVGLAGGWSSGSGAIARGARIMCLRVGGSDNQGGGWVNSVDCATAIDYAVMMGADVINASWGSSSVQHFAVVNAYSSGIIIVHSAGNANDDVPDYFDGNLSARVLTVASTTSSDKKASSSNYGDWIDVSAPGVSIYSTVSNETLPSYAIWSGTSMAAPMVSGLALLIRSVAPDMSVDDVVNLIQTTADNIDAANPGYIGLLGAGRINAEAALAAIANARFSVDSWEGEAPLNVNFYDSSPNSPTSWNWSFGNGDSAVGPDPAYTYNEPGSYTVQLEVEDNYGVSTEQLKQLIWVQADTLIFGAGAGDWTALVEVPVYINHTAFIYGIDLTFSYANSYGINYVGTSLAGLRTENLFEIEDFAWSPTLMTRGVRLKPAYQGASLAPAGGLIMKLLFEVPGGTEAGLNFTLDTASWASNSSSITTSYGAYWPESVAGQFTVVYQSCCGFFVNGQTGNADCDTDGKVNLADITALIDFVYISKEGLCCTSNGNVDGDLEGKANLTDITRLIDHVYISHESLAPCQ